MRRGGRRFGCLLAWLTFFVSMSATAETLTQTLRSAVLVHAAGERAVDLPNTLAASEFEPRGGRVKYRLKVVLDAPPDEALGIYVPKMSLSGLLVLNGEQIGACAFGELERLRCLHQPHLFVPPRSHWRVGENLLEVEIFANGRQVNGLSEVVVGPAKALAEGDYDWKFFTQVELVRGLAWAMLCLGAMLVMMWVMFPDEEVFAWFGVTTLVKALCNLNVLVQSPPVSDALFSWFVFSSRLVSVPLLMLSILIFYRRVTPLWRRLFAGSVCVMPLVVWLGDSDPRVVSALYLPFIVLGILGYFAAVRWTLASRLPRDWLMLAVVTLSLAAGAHDWFKFSGVSGFVRTYLLFFANAAGLLLMGGLIVSSLAAALRTSRQVAANLEELVARREEELKRSYARRLVLEQASARFEERERLLKDMHDGIGSSLTSARILLKSGRMSPARAADVIRECADDLRLMIDASTNAEGSLQNALADFRYRMEPRLESGGMTVHWRVDLDAMPPLETDVLLQLMRIIQEAVSNVLRHAGATTLEVAAAWDARSRLLALSLRDNGHGMPNTGTPARGKGLANMRARAARIGATIDFADAAPGTRVSLRLQVPESVDDPAPHAL